MLLRIDHETKLTYSAPVSEAIVEMRTAPPSQDDQTVLGYKLRVTPPAPATPYRDGYGNRVDWFNLLAPHTEVVVRASSCVRVHRPDAAGRAANVPLDAAKLPHVDSIEFLRPSPQVDHAPAVRAFAAAVPLDSARTVHDAAEAIMAAVRKALVYEKKVTQALTKVSDALAGGRGVCQDIAHLYLAACRLRGLPARYVSGYIHQPGELATHAWVQVWAGPEVGWVNVDPTHGRWCDNDFVVTAVGRDFADVPPNRGVFRGDAEETITVAVEVKPTDRAPDDLAEPADAPIWANRATAPPARTGWMHQGVGGLGAYRQQQSQQQQ